MTGVVTSIIDHGSIVQVYLDDGPQPINFDCRMYGHVVEAEGSLIGRTLTFSYDDDGTEIVEVD